MLLALQKHASDIEPHSRSKLDRGLRAGIGALEQVASPSCFCKAKSMAPRRFQGQYSTDNSGNAFFSLATPSMVTLDSTRLSTLSDRNSASSVNPASVTA